MVLIHVQFNMYVINNNIITVSWILDKPKASL